MFKKDILDITQSHISSFPPQWLNSAPVQESLGVPLDFTGQTMPVFKAFMATGDFVGSDNLRNIGKLLDRDLKVVLMYGDRDYQWTGGEAMSLAINSTISPGFKTAGYTNLNTNPSYVGGLVL
ncbi:hypothetical protein BJ875DRAFT_498784 [Amylocarpus encephaloides]|uniref:Uncharacterized protein n=1 Tax=Amylocarpus encephaloides TaxID=45428 RepID=A0A9P7YC03_9HELO|nr:hypothetical protein BJ875DRAFT_498784 [Amylocarpus encephaloides]